MFSVEVQWISVPVDNLAPDNETGNVVNDAIQNVRVQQELEAEVSKLYSIIFLPQNSLKTCQSFECSYVSQESEHRVPCWPRSMYHSNVS